MSLCQHEYREMGGENLVLNACAVLDIVHPFSTLTSEFSERDVQVLFVSQGQSLNTKKQTNKAREQEGFQPTQ